MIERKNHLQTVAAHERFVESIHTEKLVYFTKIYPYDVISTEVSVADLDGNQFFFHMFWADSQVVLVQLVYLRTNSSYLLRVAHTPAVNVPTLIVINTSVDWRVGTP